MPWPQNPASPGPMIIPSRTRIFCRDGRSQSHGSTVRPNTTSMAFQLSRMDRTPMPTGYRTLSRGSSRWMGLSLAS